MKRGSAHLEMILAFTIFIVAIIFLLVYLRPVETNKLSETALISLKEGFIDNVTINLITVFVNGTTNERCSPQDISDKNSTYSNFSNADNRYYVYFSDEFNTNLSNCDSNTNNVTGSVTSRSVVSNSSIQDFKKRYYEDYNNLKQQINLPIVFDFEIYTEDGLYNMTRQAPLELDIIAESHTYSVLYADGSLKNKVFVFRIW